jgi:hypothetical protein
LLIFSKDLLFLEHRHNYPHSNFNDLIAKFIPLLGPFCQHLISWGTPEERQCLAQQYAQLQHSTRNVILALDCSDFLVERKRGDQTRGPQRMWSHKLKATDFE